MDAWDAGQGNLRDSRSSEMLRFGLGSFAVALAVAVAVLKADVSLPWRALLFVPFFMASAQLLQGIHGTCALHAHKGERATAEGAEPVADPAELARHRRTARRLLRDALLLAGLATAAFVLAP